MLWWVMEISPSPCTGVSLLPFNSLGRLRPWRLPLPPSGRKSRAQWLILLHVFRVATNLVPSGKYASPSVPLHDRNDGLDAAVGSRQIHVQYLLPECVVMSFNRLLTSHARCVGQD